MLGRIKVLNLEKKYGYIRSEETKKDYCFWFLEVGDLKKDATVTFDVKRNGEYENAINIVVHTERNVTRFNTEDKKVWCLYGAQKELAFVENVVPLLGRDIIVNPEKKTNPYVIDLFDRDSSGYADLKTQNTPFFNADMYGVAPRYAVTFNKKDYERYSTLYPDCDIYFHVHWEQTEFKGKKVEPLSGVWVARFADMKKKIEDKAVPLHEYMERKNDTVNARESYVFDLRDSIFTCLLQSE